MMMMTMRETLVCIRKTATRYKPGGGETEVTVTSKRHAQAERAKRYRADDDLSAKDVCVMR